MANLTSANKRTNQLSKAKDVEAKLKRFLRRKSWFQAELARQRANRYQMALDEDYYDNEQWLWSEAAELKARGQNPVVFNECKPLVDFMIGTERRGRQDFEIIPRNDASDQAYEDARAKTKLMKYIDDINRTPYVRSEVAEDCFKSGLGWLEIAVRSDPTQDPIYKRRESWRNMLYDSLGQSKMPDEWRYVFRFKEVDFDIAEAMFPDRADDLRKCIVYPDNRRYYDWYNGDPVTGMVGAADLGLTGKWTTYDAEAWLANPRERVRLIECWSSEPFTDSTGAGAGVQQRTMLRKQVAVMTEYDTLIEEWSPYKHDRYPFIPLWCYRRKKDGAPYGMIRQQRGPQDLLNKHMSKATFRISTRQLLIENGAVDAKVMDLEEIREELSAPNGIVHLAKGAISGKKYEIREGAQLVPGDIQLAEQMRQQIRQGSGISGEQRGLDHNDVSGKARQLRADQGSLLTAEPFDNIGLMQQWEGEITLSLCEQYHTEPMTFMVSGDTKKFEPVHINKPDPKTGKLSDISARTARFVIGESPWQQSMAQSAFESAMEVLTQLASVAPQVVTNVLDVVFSMNPTLPNRQLLLRRIRQATGMTDPDNPPTPEEQDAMQQKQQVAQAQFQAQMAQLRADVAKAQAQGDQLNAAALKTRLEALYVAAEAAQVLTMAPAIAPVADELAMSAGFVDQHGQPIFNGPVPTVQAPAVPPIAPGAGPLVGHETGINSPDITGMQQPPEGA
jgi:hypothetical protein